MATPIIFTTKEQLIAALEAKRATFKKLDAKAMKEHTAAEEKFFGEWQDALTRATRWDYGTAKKNRFEIRSKDGKDFTWRGPNCPMLLVSRLDRVVAIYKQTQAKRITVMPKGAHGEAWELLMVDVPKQKAAC